jgi:sulfur carrier protein ThiS
VPGTAWETYGVGSRLVSVAGGPPPRGPAIPEIDKDPPVLVTARLRPPDRTVEVPDVQRVADLLARLEVLPSTVLVIRDGALLTSQDALRDGDRVEVRFAISGGSATCGGG